MPNPALPATLRRALSSALVLSAASIAGCGRGDDTPSVDTTASSAAAGPALAACTPPWTGGIESVPRDSILGWAGGLAYGDHDTTRARVYGLPPGAAQVNLVEGRAPDGVCWPRRRGCIIARVVTNTAQPDLGFAVGTNYVWADSAGAFARAVTIPENLGAPVVVHRLGHHRYTLGGQLPPRAISGPGGCMWCGNSCWCYWPMADTARASILRLPGDTGAVRSGRPRP